MSNFEESKENNTKFEAENIEVGKRVRYYRTRLHLSQEELALSAGIAKNSVYLIENGIYGIKCSTLMRLCDVLGVTPNDILLSEAKDNLEIREMSQVIIDGLNDEQQKIVLDVMTTLYNDFKKIYKKDNRE